jgi:[ribulose-bisphosphate carboxylase]-lysine N-methyltransferase
MYISLSTQKLNWPFTFSFQGDEVFVSYGPKSAAEYLLDYGFIPPLAYKDGATAELTFEINDQDQFLEDKLDILEFHTDQNGPMDPIQSFDISATPGRDSSPDPKMIQFLRLKKLGGVPKPLDAFLLESIFRKDVWGFMSLPVSEMNERAVVGEIIATCAEALEKMGSVEETDESLFSDPLSPKSLCRTVRSLESKALTRMLEHMQREGEALDLKEYYQERRLRELGMDSEWDPDAMDSDVGWGQKRVPGGGDLDF